MGMRFIHRDGDRGEAYVYTLNLAHARKLALLTQLALAYRAGVTVGTVSKLERCTRGGRVTTCRKLAKALGITPMQLTNTPESEEELAAWKGAIQAAYRARATVPKVHAPEPPDAA
jgi:transcriptional regulator with XRE-family HTH domain